LELASPQVVVEVEEHMEHELGQYEAFWAAV
jgi:hypothetical protein